MGKCIFWLDIMEYVITFIFIFTDDQLYVHRIDKLEAI